MELNTLALGSSNTPRVQPSQAEENILSPELPELSRPPYHSSPATCARRMEHPLTTHVHPETFHYLEKIPPTTKKAVPAKPCRVCTKNKKRKETTFVCAICPEKPALCVVNCLQIFHTDPRFV